MASAKEAHNNQVVLVRLEAKHKVVLVVILLDLANNHKELPLLSDNKQARVDLVVSSREVLLVGALDHLVARREVLLVHLRQEEGVVLEGRRAEQPLAVPALGTNQEEVAGLGQRVTQRLVATQLVASETRRRLLAAVSVPRLEELPRGLAVQVPREASVEELARASALQVPEGLDVLIQLLGG